MRNQVIIKRLGSITGHEVKSCDRTETLCGPRGSGREISVTGAFPCRFREKSTSLDFLFSSCEDGLASHHTFTNIIIGSMLLVPLPLKWLARVATLTSFKPVRLSRAHNNSSRVDCGFLSLKSLPIGPTLQGRAASWGSETLQRAGLQLPGPIFYHPLMCVRKHLDSLINPLTASINVPFYFPRSFKTLQTKASSILVDHNGRQQEH
jgi:hypothetical protein